jgi:hypothetical protein
MLRTLALSILLVYLPLQSWAQASGLACKFTASTSAAQVHGHSDTAHAHGEGHHGKQAGSADRDCDRCGACDSGCSSTLPVQPAHPPFPRASGYAPAAGEHYLTFCPEPFRRPPLFALV